MLSFTTCLHLSPVCQQISVSNWLPHFYFQCSCVELSILSFALKQWVKNSEEWEKFEAWAQVLFGLFLIEAFKSYWIMLGSICIILHIIPRTVFSAMGKHPRQASQVHDDFKVNIIIIIVKFSIYLCIDHHFPQCVPLYLSTHPLFDKITDAL